MVQPLFFLWEGVHSNKTKENNSTKLVIMLKIALKSEENCLSWSWLNVVYFNVEPQKRLEKTFISLRLHIDLH